MLTDRGAQRVAFFVPAATLTPRCLTTSTPVRAGLKAGRIVMALAAVLFSGTATSGAGLVWTLESNSPGLNQKGLSTTQVFRSPSPVPAGATITSVRVQRRASRAGYLVTTLCTAAGGAGRCVVVQGSHISTGVFNGMPAGQPFYLMHTVMGEGPLVPPMFVRASVTVWYTPPGSAQAGVELPATKPLAAERPATRSGAVDPPVIEPHGIEP